MAIKKLMQSNLNDEELSGWSNILMRLPYMLLQREGDRPDVHRCEKLFTALRNDDDVRDIKVGRIAIALSVVHLLVVIDVY